MNGHRALATLTVALPGLRVEKRIRHQGRRASLRDALAPGYGRTPLRGVPARPRHSLRTSRVEPTSITDAPPRSAVYLVRLVNRRKCPGPLSGSILIP